MRGQFKFRAGQLPSFNQLDSACYSRPGERFIAAVGRIGRQPALLRSASG